MSQGNITNAADRQTIISRINNLKPDTKNLWGKMSVNQMVCHCIDPFNDILGNRIVKPTVPSFIRPLAKMMLLSDKPFSKNLPTLKLYNKQTNTVGAQPGDFNSDKKTLTTLVENFGNTPENFECSPHAGVGKLTRMQNGKLMWKHLDHHLRQFGV